MKKYSELSIHEKINAKASASNYGERYGTKTPDWKAMKCLAGMDLLQYRYDKVYTFPKVN